jgi:hypothetical protein
LAIGNSVPARLCTPALRVKHRYRLSGQIHVGEFQPKQLIRALPAGQQRKPQRICDRPRFVVEPKPIRAQFIRVERPLACPGMLFKCRRILHWVELQAEAHQGSRRVGVKFRAHRERLRSPYVTAQFSRRAPFAQIE